MTPERGFHVGEHKVTEYLWNREFVVYLDNRRFDGTYEQACERARELAKGDVQ
jgi:hypothetical protein